jgi:site-specific DNA recombinase
MNDSNIEISRDILQSLTDNELQRLIDQDLLLELQKPYQCRAAGYIRVSRPQQALDDKYSLGQQEKRIIELIKERKWKFTQTYADRGISGTSVDGRPDFIKLLEDAQKAKFDVVVVWITDRFGRNTDEMQEIRRTLRGYAVQVLSVEEPLPIKDPRTFRFQERGMESFMEYVIDYKAEQDNKTRAKRLDLGKQGKAEKGRIPCKTPYGYKKVIEYDPRTAKKIFEDDPVQEDQARVIRYIADCYDNLDWGIRKIASQLNLDKVLSPKGGQWGYSTVKYILQNPTYAGMVRWGWRLSKSKDSRTRLMLGHKGVLLPGKHIAIISVDQFETIQKKLQIRKKLGGRAVGSKGLLVGIAKCGRCNGGTYVTQYHHWHAYRQKEGSRDRFTKTLAYLCSNYSQRGRSGCSARYVMTKSKLETFVVEEIRKLANSKKDRNKKITELKKANLENIAQEEKALVVHLNKIIEREKRQKHAYYEGIDRYEDFILNKKINEEETQRISAKLAEIRLSLSNEEAIYSRISKSLEALSDFDQIWELASFSRRKELLRAILEKVIVFEDRIQLFFVTENGSSISEHQL